MAGPKDLLPWIYSQGNATRNRLKQLLTDPRAFAGQLEQDAATVMDDSKADTYLAMAQRDPKFAAKVYPTEAVSDPSLMQGRALAHQNRLAEAVMGGMTVYHGSPHKFDKFDMSKIGTGEGAQAYGHGMYFAENKGVAEGYARVLGQREFDVGGRKIYTGSSSRVLDDQSRGQTIAAGALDDAFNAQSSSPAQFAAGRLRKQAEYYPEEAAHIKEALDIIGEWANKGGVSHMGGYTYKVDLPDDQIAKMLDWDKPLSQQSKEVQAAIGKIIQERGGSARYWEETLGSDPDGQKLVKTLGLSGGGQFEQALKGAGIPGIRYLDGMSRGKGGTSNFVVFDDQLPKIVERK
jgi:hypothetical protein